MGLNGFFHFISQPPMGEEAAKFMMGLASSGYFFPFLKTFETISGALLLAGIYVPLALVILSRKKQIKKGKKEKNLRKLKIK